MNLIYLLEAAASDANAAEAAKLCADIQPILMVVGYVLTGIKIVAPIVLIIVGMIDMTKAIAGKDEDTIKKAQKALGKKAIAAVCVFLIATMVGVIMGLVGGAAYKADACKKCLNEPWTCTPNSNI